MPGFYQQGEYDLAGFCVGIVEKQQLLNGSQVQVGDIAIGLASQGVHSNGFSLIRKIVSNRGLHWKDVPWKGIPDLDLGDQSLGEVLLTPTQIYVKPVLEGAQAGLELHGMAHITGGGIPENLPRCLGPSQSVQIYPQQWPIPPIFNWIASTGEIGPVDMFHTFNMGIGFVLLVPSNQVDQALKWFLARNIAAYPIGEVVTGEGTVIGLPD